MPKRGCMNQPCPHGTHEIYCCGSKVRITEKGVQTWTEPMVEYCPLHERLYGTKSLDRESVRKSVEKKIAGFGFCCRNRAFDAQPVVAYGASEMMRVWLEKNLIDCAVIVCDGAGTVITTNGELVQAIGARLTGIVETSPIREVIRHIKKENGVILDEVNARIDQAEGARQAFSLGHNRIAVSVAGFQARVITEIRRFEKEKHIDVLVYSVCNTCVRSADVKHVAGADVACASASKMLRSRIGSKALLQLGITIPVYALTEKGKRLILAYLADFSDKLVAFRTSKLPYDAEGKGPRLKA